MSQKPLVSVVIPCRNEAQYIESCVRSVLAQSGTSERFEIIVADGVSHDNTRDILARLGAEVSGQWSEATSQSSHLPSPISHPPALPVPPPLRVINNPGRIASTGLNAAIRSASGQIIIRFDAHTEYAPDYIHSCVEILDQTGADNVGGPWVAKGDRLVSRAIAAAFQSPFAVGGARGHDSGYEGLVDTVYLGCWRRSAFEKFGCFDEELVRNQDDEHNLRIIRGGGKIYQSPKIKSWYKPRGSLTALFKQYMQYGYWKVRVIQKHKLPASPRHLVPGAFVLAMLLLSLTSILCPLIFAIWPSRLPSSASGPEVPWSVVSGQWSVVSLLASLSAYALALITASLITAAKTEWKLLPVLPAVFACYHFGYGYGFLRGIWDFVIRRKGAQKTFTDLTR